MIKKSFLLGTKAGPLLQIYIRFTEHNIKLGYKSDVMANTDRCSVFISDKWQYHFCPIFKILFKASSLSDIVGAAEK